MSIEVNLNLSKLYDEALEQQGDVYMFLFDQSAALRSPSSPAQGDEAGSPPAGLDLGAEMEKEAGPANPRVAAQVDEENVVGTPEAPRRTRSDQAADAAREEQGAEQGGEGHVSAGALRMRGRGRRGGRRMHMGGRAMYKVHSQTGGTVYRGAEIDEAKLDGLRKEAQMELDECRPKAEMKLRSGEEKFTPEEFKAQKEEDKAEQAAVLAQEELDAIEDEAADEEAGETPSDGAQTGQPGTSEPGTSDPGSGTTPPPVQQSTWTEAELVGKNLPHDIDDSEATSVGSEWKDKIWTIVKDRIEQDVNKLENGQQSVNYNYADAAKSESTGNIQQQLNRAKQTRDFLVGEKDNIRPRMKEACRQFVHVASYDALGSLKLYNNKERGEEVGQW